MDGIGRDPGAVVGGAGAAVEHGKLAAVEASGQQFDEVGEEQDPLVKRPRSARRCGEVERVQRDAARAGQRQVRAADGLAEAVVLVLGVEDEHLHAPVEQPQRFELRRRRTCPRRE